MEALSPAHFAAQWVVPSALATSIVAALQAHMVAIRRERGCTTCSLATEAGEAVHLSYRENWETEGDLRRHLESERFAAFAGLLETGVAPPVVEFVLPCGVRGLDYAIEIREKHDRTHQSPSAVDVRRPGHGR